MSLIIRQENEKDYSSVENLIKKVFENEEYSDHKEHFLVSRLRKSTSFIPELSLVAEYNGLIIGHILLTKLVIKNGDKSFDSLALAPVSVRKEDQNKGVGSRLILESNKIAKNVGYEQYESVYHPRPYVGKVIKELLEI
ncbi:MAG: GNAT family N-acetyltransferase [Candidatus Sericytochromatia bacterium]